MDVMLVEVVPVFHLALSACLLAFVLWVALHPPSAASTAPPEGVSDAEAVRRAVAEWTPEPLVTPSPPASHPALHPRVVTGKAAQMLAVEGVGACLNVATHDYLDVVGSARVERRAVACVAQYGVGSCGPRAFYGTFDVHLQLERRLAAFLRVEEVALYAYGFCTASSALPAYAKRRDVVFADERVHFALQKGLDASRSTVRFFRHNDVTHLEELLEEQRLLDEKEPSLAKCTRRFLVVEGVYADTGTLCPLPALVRLKHKHKLRLLIDESVSFGTIGKGGRGVTEHFELSIDDDVDLVMCSMERALATVGGFCAGSSFVVEHQRLSGLGYCFSASLPPVLAVAALEALDVLEEQTAVQALALRCRRVQTALHALETRGLKNISDIHSPIKHLVLTQSSSSDDDEADTRRLRAIADRCVETHAVAVVVAAYLHDKERFRHTPSIRVAVHSQLTDEHVATLCTALAEACEHVLLTGTHSHKSKDD